MALDRGRFSYPVMNIAGMLEVEKGARRRQNHKPMEHWVALLSGDANRPNSLENGIGNVLSGFSAADLIDK
jgi:hypothetical protein